MTRRKLNPITTLSALLVLGGPALVSCAKIAMSPPEEPVRASVVKALPPHMSVTSLECSWLEEGQGAYLCRFKAAVQTEADLYTPADRGARATAMGITDQQFIYGRFAGVQFISLASPKGTAAEVFGRVSVAKYGATWQATEAMIEGGGSLSGAPLASFPQGSIVAGSPEEATLKAEHDKLVADRLKAQEEQRAAIEREQQAKAAAARVAEELRLKRVADGKAAMTAVLTPGRKWSGFFTFPNWSHRGIAPMPVSFAVDGFAQDGASVSVTIRAGDGGPEPCQGNLVLVDEAMGGWRCDMVWKRTTKMLGGIRPVDCALWLAIGEGGMPMIQSDTKLPWYPGGIARLEPAQ
jgi:hypothetical protein